MHRSDKIVPIDWPKVNPNNARVHSARQIKALARSMSVAITAPIIVDETGRLLAGHARLAAARLLGLTELPAVILEGLSEARKRALMLADNKIAEDSRWDRKRLAVELPELTLLLAEDGLDIDVSGFAVPEIDQIVIDFENARDPADDLDPADHDHRGTPVSRPGEVWQLNEHRLSCGSALDREAVARLMDGAKAAVAILDAPYNVPSRAIGGRGRIKHDNFAMASGEMSEADFQAFLKDALAAAAAVSAEGALHYAFMDWRHFPELAAAGRDAYGTPMVNLVVWDKTNAGQGSFYRSQHELIAVFRVGAAPYRNNVQLGRFGRNRSNVWRYAGVNTFRTGRMDDLAVHPTVKPVALIADAIKDCTRPGDLVLDTFAGSGSTILAAERVGRRAHAMDIEPRYIDAAIRRWQACSGRDAVLTDSGRTFDDLAADRQPETPSSAQASARTRIKGRPR